MKVQVHTLRRKPLAPVRVDENKLVTATIKSKEKPVVGGSYRLAASGIENVKGLAASNKKENIVKGKATGSRTQKCNSKGVAAGTNITGQKGTSNSIQQGHDRTGLAGKVRKSILNNICCHIVFIENKKILFTFTV